MVNLWVIGTVRNEVDLVEPYVRHHLAQGVTGILLLDNGSSDGTQDVLADLGRELPLQWNSSPGAFDQPALLTRLALQAAETGADWIIAADLDEFWLPRTGTLAEALAASPTGRIRVQPVTYVQHQSERFTEFDSLLRMTRRAVPIGPSEAGELLVESERAAYVEHLYHQKWIYPATSDLRIGWGNHTGASSSREVTPAVAIDCLHAPLRSFAVLQAKADEVRPAGEVRDYFAVAWHLRRWRRMIWEGRIEAEWRANSCDSHGNLDVHGVSRATVEDERLRRAVEPYLQG